MNKKMNENKSQRSCENHMYTSFSLVSLTREYSNDNTSENNDNTTHENHISTLVCTTNEMNNNNFYKLQLDINETI